MDGAPSSHSRPPAPEAGALSQNLLTETRQRLQITITASLSSCFPISAREVVADAEERDFVHDTSPPYMSVNSAEPTWAQGTEQIGSHEWEIFLVEP
jgi:hypothetical protein